VDTNPDSLATLRTIPLCGSARWLSPGLPYVRQAIAKLTVASETVMATSLALALKSASILGILTRPAAGQGSRRAAADFGGVRRVRQPPRRRFALPPACRPI